LAAGAIGRPGAITATGTVVCDTGGGALGVTLGATGNCTVGGAGIGLPPTGGMMGRPASSGGRTGAVCGWAASA